jgi:hypothetical protein
VKSARIERAHVHAAPEIDERDLILQAAVLLHASGQPTAMTLVAADRLNRRRTPMFAMACAADTAGLSLVYGAPHWSIVAAVAGLGGLLRRGLNRAHVGILGLRAALGVATLSYASRQHSGGDKTPPPLPAHTSERVGLETPEKRAAAPDG